MNRIELLPRFEPQSVQTGVIEIGRERGILERFFAFDLNALLFDISVVMREHLNLFLHIRFQRFERVIQPEQVCVPHLRALQKVKQYGAALRERFTEGFEVDAQRVARRNVRSEPLQRFLNTLALLFERGFARIADQAEPEGAFGEAKIGIVLPQKQPVFAAAGHHAIRFGGSFGGKIVDKDADIGVASSEIERLLALHVQGGVDARVKALRGSFLIAARSVHLTRRKEPGHILDHES